MTQEMNQQNWRHNANIPDEFGRIWLVNLDKRPDGGGSWGLASPPMPVGWTDPLRTPAQYIDQPVGVGGRTDPNKLRVLPGLQKWVATQKRHEADWKQRAFMVAQRLFGTAAHQMIQSEDETLMLEVGPKPFPSSTVIQAAINGHKGFLGLAPLTKDDRALLGVQNLEDMGYAAEPTVAEPSPAAEPEPRMSFFAFAAKMKKEGITDKDEIRTFWDVYKAETVKA